MPKLLANLVGKDINFEKWHVFFVDERCVPLDDDESNYKACLEHLFSKVPIPEGQIHPIDFSQGSPEAIGEEYAEQLRSLWGTEPPAFDAILLGVGPDGHTASLFPGHPLNALVGPEAPLVASLADSPKPPPARITFTRPVIDRARRIMFMAGGAGKAELFAEIFGISEEDGSLCYKAAVDYPCVKVSPEGGAEWYIDQAAAAQLSQELKERALTCAL